MRNNKKIKFQRLRRVHDFDVYQMAKSVERVHGGPSIGLELSVGLMLSKFIKKITTLVIFHLLRPTLHSFCVHNLVPICNVSAKVHTSTNICRHKQKVFTMASLYAFKFIIQQIPIVEVGHARSNLQPTNQRSSHVARR